MQFLALLLLGQHGSGHTTLATASGLDIPAAVKNSTTKKKKDDEVCAAIWRGGDFRTAIIADICTVGSRLKRTYRQQNKDVSTK